MRDDFQIWVDAVCEQVRFWPDRKGIEKELRIHYEDRCRALERLHYERPLAAQRSLEAMGNAQEVGRALDRVHKPWLGWLWEVSRCLALALTVLALSANFLTIGLPTLAERTRGELAWEEPPESASRVELEHATIWAAPGDLREQDGKTVAEVRLWIKMRDPLAANGGVGTLFFTWRDDKGELSRWEFDSFSRTGPESRYWTYNAEASSTGWTRFRQTVKLVLDGPPRWAEASYPLSGGDWTLQVKWEEAL